MTWILILSLLTHDGVALEKIEFNSKKECIDAGNAFSRMTDGLVFSERKSLCVPKTK